MHSSHMHGEGDPEETSYDFKPTWARLRGSDAARGVCSSEGVSGADLLALAQELPAPGTLSLFIDVPRGIFACMRG